MKFAKRARAFLLLGILVLSAIVYGRDARDAERLPFVFDTSSRFFIEVERELIRLEWIVKAIPLAELIDEPIDGEHIDAIQQARLKTRSLDFFSDCFIMAIEGLPVAANEARADFLNIGDPNSLLKTTPEDEVWTNAVLGITFTYERDDAPDYFQFEWTRFPDQLGKMPTRVRALENTRETDLGPYVSTVDWKRGELRFDPPGIEPVPVSDAGWLGRGHLTEIEAAEVTGQLFRNIFAAFEFREESDAYDQLAKSVSDERIAEVYLNHRKRVEALRRGGPSVKIEKVVTRTIESIERADGQTLKIRGEWDVFGRVTHYGHTHQRKNRYLAELTLDATERHWKISEIVTLGEERIGEQR